MVPTTLLAMVDSSVGGKVGVNHAAGQEPDRHLPSAGRRLDRHGDAGDAADREYRSGLAEVVKYGVILDAELFAYLEENADAVLRPRAGRGAAHRAALLPA